MARNVSIEISAQDNFTKTITTMRNVSRAFGKDLTGLSQKLDALNETKCSLKLDTDKAYSALEKAEKKFKRTGKAADEAAMKFASQKYETARRNLGLVAQSADETEKSMISLTGAIEKADNRTSKSSFGKETAGKLAQSGLGQMAIDTATNAIGTFATSAFGSKTGNMVSGVVGGAASGALMGSVVPGIGTAIGAVVGGISGAVNAEMQDFENKDEAFRSVVQQSYDTVTKEKENSLANGTSVAAAREQDQLKFSTLLGGEGHADDFLSKITDFASTTPYDYSQAAALSSDLLNRGYKQDEILPLLTKVGDAGSALGMSADVQNGLVEAIADMKTAGTVGQNDLAPFLRQGIDVWKYLADSSGKTEAEVQDLASKDQLSGKDAAEAIANGLGKNYSGGMEKQSQTYAGLQENLQEAQNSIDAARGEGYTEERKEGVQKKISSLNGSTGDALKEAYAMEGKFQASLENRKDELEQNALAGIVSGNVTGKFSDKNQARLQELAVDYKKSMKGANEGDEEAELQAERDIEEAKIIAANEYKATKGYKLEVESQKSLVQRIRDDTVLNDEYYDTGYQWGIEMSKGISAAQTDNWEHDLALEKERRANAEKDLPPLQKFAVDFWGFFGIPSFLTASGNATGLNRVPYNNFPTLLHEGEQVLTGVEARSGTVPPGVTVTGNTFNVRRESDIDGIASQLFEKIKRAALVTPS